MDFDANRTQKEVTDISTHSIKPSGPSVIIDVEASRMIKMTKTKTPPRNQLKNSNVSTVINFV